MLKCRTSIRRKIEKKTKIIKSDNQNRPLSMEEIENSPRAASIKGAGQMFYGQVLSDLQGTHIILMLFKLLQIVGKKRKEVSQFIL